MPVLKPEPVERLDTVSAAVSELAEFIDTLASISADEADQTAWLSRAAETVQQDLENLAEERRELGQLPAQGNLDKAALSALGIAAQSVVHRGANEGGYFPALAEALQQTAAEVRSARKKSGQPERVKTALTRLELSLRTLHRDLHSVAA